MIKNKNLLDSKKAKNDEFYTQWIDIEKEIMAYIDFDPDVFRDKTILLPCDNPEYSNFTKFFINNFTRFGIKKLISTCYSQNKRLFEKNRQLSFFTNNQKYNFSKNSLRGKKFILNSIELLNGKIDMNNLRWEYLHGCGDFRSDEVKKLREEADIIITNPPFSLFREFFAWITETEKKFLIIGNINCISYKGIFTKIKNNTVWLGANSEGFIRNFIVFKNYELMVMEHKLKNGKQIVAEANGVWLTNLKHGRQPKPLKLMTMADNIKHSKHKEIRGIGYQKYDNYDAIEVPYTDVIPDDYEGIMGVPITFMDKYNPEQFELLDIKNDCLLENKKVFKRIFIRKI